MTACQLSALYAVLQASVALLLCKSSIHVLLMQVRPTELHAANHGHVSAGTG